MIAQFVIALLISILFSAVNFDAYLKGGMPTMLQTASTFLYIALWFIYAATSSYRKAVKYRYLKFSSLYWGVALISLAAGHIFQLAIIQIPSLFLFAGPLYGLRSIIGGSSDIYLVLLSALIAYILGLIGFLTGYLLKLLRKQLSRLKWRNDRKPFT